VKKLLLTTVAFTTLFSGAAFAQTVVRGTAQAYYAAEQGGIPYVMPFVSDRTARRVRNFQPGPFHESGPDDKVEWRRYRP
jgi:hypothetical protein